MNAKKKLGNEEEEESIREAFHAFDVDGDGYLDEREMRRVLHRLALDCTEVELMDIIREADLNGDGKIDFTEFHTMMMKEEPKRESAMFTLADMFDTSRHNRAPPIHPPTLGNKAKTHFQ